MPPDHVDTIMEPTERAGCAHTQTACAKSETEKDKLHRQVATALKQSLAARINIC